MSEPVPARAEIRVADLLALRSYAGSADERSAVVRVVVESAPGALALVPRPEWPPLISLRSRRAEGGWLVVARFARPVPPGARGARPPAPRTSGPRAAGGGGSRRPARGRWGRGRRGRG